MRYVIAGVVLTGLMLAAPAWAGDWTLWRVARLHGLGPFTPDLTPLDAFQTASDCHAALHRFASRLTRRPGDRVFDFGERVIVISPIDAADQQLVWVFDYRCWPAGMAPQ